MRTYVISTGIVFGLLTLAHVWRAILEPHLAQQPSYIGVTLVAGGLTLWAWRVLRNPAEG